MNDSEEIYALLQRFGRNANVDVLQHWIERLCNKVRLDEASWWIDRNIPVDRSLELAGMQRIAELNSALELVDGHPCPTGVHVRCCMACDHDFDCECVCHELSNKKPT